MDENWYTNESVLSLSFSYPDPQEDLKKKKANTSLFSKQLVPESWVQFTADRHAMGYLVRSSTETEPNLAIDYFTSSFVFFFFLLFFSGLHTFCPRVHCGWHYTIKSPCCLTWCISFSYFVTKEL